MAKLLKPLVIIQLLLSIVAAVFAWMLFDKREVLKSRAQKMEGALANVASKIHDDTFKVASLVVADKTQIGNMDAPLGKLGAAAGNLWDSYVFTSNKLDETRTELALTKEDLNQTKATLEQTQAEVAQLNDKLAAKETELAQANAKITEVEQQVAGLKTQIEDLNTQIAKVEEEKRGLKDDLESEKQRALDLEGELFIAQGKTRKMRLGTSGSVLVVNKDWNFVVVDVGSNRGGQVSGELLVHRDDKLIGKVRITSMTKELALAEIIDEWQAVPFKEGDKVVY
jgi:septal ring factor EnvC (AmiA/AmiB activator)